MKTKKLKEDSVIAEALEKLSKFMGDAQDYFESKSLDERFVCVVKQLYELCEKAKLL